MSNATLRHLELAYELIDELEDVQRVLMRGGPEVGRKLIGCFARKAEIRREIANLTGATGTCEVTA